MNNEKSLDNIWQDYKGLENPADFEELMAEHHFKNGFRAGYQCLRSQWYQYFNRMTNIAHTQGTQEQGFRDLIAVLSEWNQDMILSNKTASNQPSEKE
jgi:hypothetical protein